MRRWAAAASVVALLSGGYLWWTSWQPLPSGELIPSAVSEAVVVQPVVAKADKVIAPEVADSPVATKEYTIQKERQQLMAEELPQQTAEEYPEQTVEDSSEQTKEEVTQQTTETPRHQATEWPQREVEERPMTKTRRQVSLGLYAMNGLGSQHGSNGVQMADALAREYAATNEHSYATSSRRSEPIYLIGYEERQHHHRPVTYGLSLSYPLSDRFALTSGVVYTKLRSDFTQIMRNQQIQQEQMLHYVGIPLSLNYRLWAYKGFDAYLSAGVKADWNVATHLETEGVRQTLPKDRMQWSLNGSLGLQYNVVPQLGVYAEPSLNWYPDNGSVVQNYFKDKPLSMGLQLGLRLNLR